MPDAGAIGLRPVLPASPAASRNSRPSPGDPAMIAPAQSFRKLRPGDLTPQEAQRAWFAGLLWQAFPGRSATAVSQDAAAELTRLGVPASERQVRNWLRCEHDPSFVVVTAVLAIVGAERILDVLPERGR